MTGFKKFYLWGMNTKLYMGIYFAAIVFVCGLILALNGQTSLSLLVLLEMFILSFAVAILQSVLVPDTTDFSGGIFAARAMLWALASALMTFAASACLGWPQTWPWARSCSPDSSACSSGSALSRNAIPSA